MSALAIDIERESKIIHFECVLLLTYEIGGVLSHCQTRNNEHQNNMNDINTTITDEDDALAELQAIDEARFEYLLDNMEEEIW
jgi:hypothetical protein